MRVLIGATLLVVGAGCSPAPVPAPPPLPKPAAEKPREPAPAPAVAIAPIPGPERYDFKGETPGVLTLDEFRTRHTIPAEQPFTSEGREVVGVVQGIIGRDQLTVAGRDVLKAEYTFVDGTLARIDLYCAPERFHETWAAIREKYGDSSEESAGRHIWKGTRGNLVLMIRERSLIVAFEDNQLSAEVVRRAIAAKDLDAKANAKDL